ncbi:MAG: glucose-6-phosphate isomerase [Proteobacteria bacterium]|nr:glucose-6-phosphate isomerase [Pseudomonadota bacterium]
MSAIGLSTDKLEPFVKAYEVKNIAGDIKAAAKLLQDRTGPGSDFLGWLDLPSSTPEKLIDEVKEAASEIRSNAEAFISIGIGGSYLGARAAIEFSKHSFNNQLVPAKRKAPEVYFAGQNISSDYLSDLLDIMEDRQVCLNIISKSGTTTEPAIAFRILKSMMEKRYGKKGAKDRIVVTTDRAKGALKQVADEEGYKSFVIPDDVGGRYSVLTPVGLLPIAVAGIDISEMILGARTFEGISKTNDIEENPACLYAATRKLLYEKGKQIEILSSFHPSLHYVAEWWKQLAGESEGKGGQGIFPASVDLTTDLHSMGQWIQEGQRNIFETFLTVERSNRQLAVPEFEDDGDALNYIAGKTLDYVNEKAYQGTAEAHRDGGVPNMTISLKNRSARTLGELFYFFEYSVALSGYLLGVNPFDQPGVEFYKRNMFRLLGKKI